MDHDISILAEQVRTLDQSISGLGSGDVVGILAGIMHRPGWTTLREIELFTASVEQLQGQVDAVKDHYTKLISIADKIGRD